MMGKLQIAVASVLTASALDAFTLDEDFSVTATDGGSAAIEIERTSALSHGHGQIRDRAYHILVCGNRHYLAMPPAKDFELTLDYDLTIQNMAEFGLGYDVYFRRDRVTGEGHMLRIWWDKTQVLRFYLDGKAFFERKDETMPATTGQTLKLVVRGTRLTVETLGATAAYDLPVSGPGAGKIAFDMPYSGGNMLVIRRARLTTDDEPAFTETGKWDFTLSQSQGFVYPATFTVTAGKWATGETKLDVTLSGMLPGRPPREPTGGGEWCSMAERLTDPYVRIEAADGKRKLLKLWEGRRQFADPAVQKSARKGTGEAALKLPPWPVSKSYCISHFPADFSLAAGYGYAMAHPWRFAENGPWEQIRDKAGRFVYEGEAVLPERVAFKAKSPADKKIVARIPADLPDREQALKHAREQHHFLASETIRFTLEGVFRATDFAAAEITFKPRFENVYGDDLADGAFTAGAVHVENLPAGLCRVSQDVTLAKNPGIGVWRLVTEIGFGSDRRKENTEFEVLSDEQGGPCPPLASGLPYFFSMANETKFLEEGAFDPWADRSGVGLYYTAEAYYAKPGLRKHVADALHVYDRKWWAQNHSRNCADTDPRSAFNREVARKADLVSCNTDGSHRFDFTQRSSYRGQQMQLLADYAAEKKPPFRLLTPARLAQAVKDGNGITKEEFRELFGTCWEDFCDWARPRVEEMQKENDRFLLSVNPKIARGTYGPMAIYVAAYKTPYWLRNASIALEGLPEVRANGSFWVLEEYHYSCDYPIYRASLFVQGLAMAYPNTRKVFPEIYYSGWGRCNDGAVFQAHPGMYCTLAPTHQRKIAYHYAYGTAYLKGGKFGYWKDYGFHARNPERAAMDEFVRAWGNLQKNKPAEPLKAPYSMMDFGAFRRHGDYLETECNLLISIGDAFYDGPGDVCNTAEEAIAWSYEQAVGSGYNTPVLSTFADLDNITTDRAEFVMLPPIVAGTPKDTLDAIRRLHARGVNLLCFESCVGLEDLFGVKDAPARPLRALGDETFKHKLAVVKYAAGGGAVAIAGAERPNGLRDVPVLVTHRTASGRTAFFTLPPTAVNRAHFRGRYTRGQPQIGEEMPKAARAAFDWLASSKPAVKAEHGNVAAVKTEKGDYAVVLFEESPLYGEKADFPLSFRFTVSAPGIENAEITADAPYAVVSKEPGRVTLRTETAHDTALFFKFAMPSLADRIAKTCKVTGRDLFHGFRRTTFEFKGHTAWVVEPYVKPAEGRPWTWTIQWATAFVDRTPALHLLKEGWHHVTIDTFRHRMDDEGIAVSAAFQKFLVDELGFSPKTCLIGMSWGGFFSTRYAVAHPKNVRAIYYDCPLLSFDKFRDLPPEKVGNEIGVWAKSVPAGGWSSDPRMPVNMAEPLAAAKIPVYLLYGGADRVVPPEANSELFYPRFKAAGGEITVECRKAWGHHPHGVEPDDTRLADFFRSATKPPID